MLFDIIPLVGNSFTIDVQINNNISWVGIDEVSVSKKKLIPTVAVHVSYKAFECGFSSA